MPLNKENWTEYWGNKEPKCPYCDEEICIDDHEYYDLYNEDTHDTTCPYCEKDIKIRTSISYAFSTDNQDQD